MAKRKSRVEDYSASLPSSLDEVIERAERRGQRLSDHVRGLMRAWLENVGATPAGTEAGIVHPDGRTYIQLRMFPLPCDCADCKEPALIFPPDMSCPVWSNGLNGYCLCPHCSLGVDRPQEARA